MPNRPMEGPAPSGMIGSEASQSGVVGMDFYMILLRFLHIAGGVFWVGTIFFMAFFLMPAVQAAGPDGGKFMKVFGRVSNLSRVLPLAALTTIISGLLMFWRLSGFLSPAWLTTPAGIALSIGGLAALLAFFGPANSIARTMKRTMAIAQAMESAGGPPSEAKMAELKGLQAKIPGYYRQLTFLMAVAVLCMAIFRYL